MEANNLKPLTKDEFDVWATATKETLNSIEHNMSTKDDMAGVKSDVACVQSDLATVKSDLATAKNEILTSVDTLTKRLTTILDQDYPFQKKRISRVEFRTEKLLKKRLTQVDTQFEEQYPGETSATVDTSKSG